MSNTEKDLDLPERIKSRTARVVVWGAGFIGLSAAEAFVAAGFTCLVVDVDRTRVEAVNAGRVPLPGFEARVHLDPAAIQAGRLAAAAPDDPAVAAGDVHIVCVNTDRGGVPVIEPLRAVLSGIRAGRTPGRPLLVSIESTVSKAWLDDVVLACLTGGAPVDDELHLATAPRRDWMLSPEMNLRTLPRVVGVADPRSRDMVAELYGAVTDQVHFARDWIHSALTKPVENLFRFVDLVLANQLREAYPGVDTVEVLRLAGTKWNVPTYHPSLGIGGYCIPLSPHFVGDQLFDIGALPMVRAAVDWNAEYAGRVADWIIGCGPGPYGILGLSYAGDARIVEGSPSVRLAEALTQRGCAVLMHDPFFSAPEIRAMSAAQCLAYPEGLRDVGTVVIATAHSIYQDLPAQLAALDRPPAVVDNMGSFRSMLGDGHYVEVGGLRA